MEGIGALSSVAFSFHASLSNIIVDFVDIFSDAIFEDLKQRS